MRKSFIDNWLYLSAGFPPGRVRGWAAGLAAVVLFLGSVATALEPVAVLAPPSESSADFGSSVAISGRYIVVGDPGGAGGDGAVYVFRRQGARWIEQAKLTAFNPEWNAKLGTSVAVDGDVIVACAPAWSMPTDCGGLPQGSASVFRRNDGGTPDDLGDDTWEEEARLGVPLVFGVDLFGESAAISGDSIVIGTECGGAAVFRLVEEKWTHEITMVGDSNFGASVDVDNGHVKIGAGANIRGSGSTFIFERHPNRWGWYRNEATFFPAGEDRFRPAVAIDGNWAVSGLGRQPQDLPASGALAYVYEAITPLTWAHVSTLTAMEPVPAHSAARSVAIDRDLILVGVERAPEPTSASPGALLFVLVDGVWQSSKALQGPLDAWPFSGPAVALDGDYAIAHTSVYAVRSLRSLVDYALYQRCMLTTGPTWAFPECESLDLFIDHRIDLVDFEIAVGTIAGP